MKVLRHPWATEHTVNTVDLLKRLANNYATERDLTVRLFKVFTLTNICKRHIKKYIIRYITKYLFIGIFQYKFYNKHINMSL